jgi:predicted MFS family arabinose efflux permease
MLPLSLFRSARFSGANALTALLYAALGAAVFLLPFQLIRVHGYSASAAGAAFLPFSAIMGIGSRWAGGLVERVGARLPLMVGPALAALGFSILGWSGHDARYWVGFLPGLVVVAVGMTITIPPLTTTVFDAAPAQQSGTASGINNAAARMGSLLAVAALGLALGGSATATGDPAHLARAYRIVMLIAAAVAAASVLVAAFTMGPERPRARS